MRSRCQDQFRLLAWVAILVVAHVPFPCYDGDGENRGTPIDGIFDPAGWQIVFLGVPPEKDVDRGPFSSDDEQRHVGGSAFDAPSVVATSLADIDSPVLRAPVSSGVPAFTLLFAAAPQIPPPIAPATFSSSYSARAPQAWRQQLRRLLI